MSRYQGELERLATIVSHAVTARAAMTAQQLHVFLAIARWPGSSVSEIVQHTGYPLTSVSRIVDILSEWESFGKPGAGLVEGVQDPLQRRRKLVYLTAKGRDLVTRMMMALTPMEQVEPYTSATPKSDLQARLKNAARAERSEG